MGSKAKYAYESMFLMDENRAVRETGNFNGIKCYTLGYANVDKTGDKLNQIEQGIEKTSIDFLQKPQKMFPRACEAVRLKENENRIAQFAFFNGGLSFYLILF